MFSNSQHRLLHTLSVVCVPFKTLLQNLISIFRKVAPMHEPKAQQKCTLYTVQKVQETDFEEKTYMESFFVSIAL